jgi:hypothetical protein
MASSLRSLSFVGRGRNVANLFRAGDLPESKPDSNPLREYYNSVTTGPGVWKWEHYLDVYHRHLQKFIGQACHIAEVGVYSGGSLKMWMEYFGSRATIYGIDCQPACKAYENDLTRIFIGDQGSRSFWRDFKEQVPQLDALIDDGGHLPEQQIVTLEEILPHLRPGGVFICEDIAGERNHFSAYLHGLNSSLNAHNMETATLLKTTALQSAIASVHFYPFIVVVEKRKDAPCHLHAPKRGMEWQPWKL